VRLDCADHAAGVAAVDANDHWNTKDVYLPASGGGGVNGSHKIAMSSALPTLCGSQRMALASGSQAALVIFALRKRRGCSFSFLKVSHGNFDHLPGTKRPTWDGSYVRRTTWGAYRAQATRD
jgi:hypothetical protein